MPSLGNTQTEPNRKVVKIPRNNLRTEQPHLWQRVFGLALAFFAMGLPLFPAPPVRAPNATVSIMAELLSLHYHAYIFVGISLLLFMGSFFSRKNYVLTRLSLSVALAYALMWLLSLFYGAFTGNISSFAIVSLWAFFTYIILNTLQDPGFTISDLIREVRKHHNVK